MVSISVFFFFQAEDGIRDYKVTGVQTCALPISVPPRVGKADRGAGGVVRPHRDEYAGRATAGGRRAPGRHPHQTTLKPKIGRGAWRGRGENSVGAVSLKKKKKNKNQTREKQSVN